MQKLSELLLPRKGKAAPTPERVIARLMGRYAGTREMLELWLYHPEDLAETIEMLSREAPDVHGALTALRGAFLTRYGQTHHKQDCERCRVEKARWELL